jgi:hypothetical protein
MSKYESLTLHNSKIPAGIQMVLDEEQFRKRRYLGTNKDGIFVSEQAIQFKLGEVVELKEELDMKYYGGLFKNISAVKTEGIGKEVPKSKKKQKGKVI